MSKASASYPDFLGDEEFFPDADQNDRHDYAVWCFSNAAQILANDHGYTGTVIAAIVARAIEESLPFAEEIPEGDEQAAEPPPF